jgi:enoyl-CoA hydratase
MSEGEVRYQRRGAVAEVVFDRPQARNAMTFPMYEQLYEACERIDADPEVRVAVLRGAGGRAFVAGTDIAQFTTFEGGEDGIAYEARIERIVSRLEAVRVPTLAVVQGPAVGGGLVISATCDLRVCTPDARFGVPIARTLGNCLSMRNLARLVSMIGTSRTRWLLLGAGLVDAAQALEAGLVVEVIEPERLDERVAELCAALAGHAPITMQVTKEGLRRLIAHGLPEDEDLVRAAFGSADFKEGVEAFLAKRPPQWKGR